MSVRKEAPVALVVDDDEGVRLLLEHVLDGIGCTLRSAGRGDEAMAALEEGPCDLVVLDKNLPDRSGLDLLAEIKGRDPDLEVVLVTGYASLESAVTALRLGAGDFLLKPFDDVDILAEKLLAGIERGRRARERTRLISDLQDRERNLRDQVAARTRQLEAAVEALRVRDEERRRLMADVAHDLRTPLTTMRGYVDLLGRKDLSDEKRGRYLTVLGSQAQRLERLTQDVIFLVRNEDGRVTWRFAPQDTRALLEAALDEIRPLFEPEGVQVRVTLSPGAERVRADRDRITQVLMNLLGNAARFAPAGSTVEVTAEPDEEAVVLSVCDVGPGVPPEREERVFDRYHTDDEAGRGEGIGLSICKDIAEAHGGRIWVEAGEEGGATFRILLPWEDASVALGD